MGVLKKAPLPTPHPTLLVPWVHVEVPGEASARQAHPSILKEDGEAIRVPWEFLVVLDACT